MAIFGIFSTPLGWLLGFLYSIIGNYGITLIVLTFIVKLCLYPLYKKQMLTTANMPNIQPKMQEIQKKYANDRETMNAKMAELYKEEGYNPMSGCLPMLVQAIILMGFFNLVRNPMNYFSSNEMYFAIHEQFLWIRDLSQPDLWILPIITGVATFFSFWMNSQNNLNGGQQAANGMMKGMQYLFPLMFAWMARSYPSALAIYWFFGQIIQIIYNLRFKQIKKALKEKENSGKKKKKKK